MSNTRLDPYVLAHNTFDVKAFLVFISNRRRSDPWINSSSPVFCLSQIMQQCVLNPYDIFIYVLYLKLISLWGRMWFSIVNSSFFVINCLISWWYIAIWQCSEAGHQQDIGARKDGSINKEHSSIWPSQSSSFPLDFRLRSEISQDFHHDGWRLVLLQ